MKAHSRKHHAKGGEAEHGVVEKDEAVKDVYAGGNSPTEKEAQERKHGGRAKRKHGGNIAHLNAMHKEHHHEHPKAEHRAKRKRGGHVMHAEHAVKGEHAKHRADRKARKSGGEVGANMHPFSTAHKGIEPAKHKSYEPEHD
jgi:hypothetical protein